MNVTAASFDSLKRSLSISKENKSKKKHKDFHSIDVADYFRHQRTFANVKLVINGEMIWCDKAALAAASPVLRSMFVKSTNDIEIFLFHDIDLDEFLLFLQFIYPIFNPEINETNISALIQLAHRFQFDVLQQACQVYVMEYLHRIRHVFGKCHQSEDEEDDCSSNQKIPHYSDERQHYNERDLIEFSDGTCVAAHSTVLKLCQWLKIYFQANNRTMIDSILSVLERISVDGLEQSLVESEMNEIIKTSIYKSRAQYLEEISQIKRIA